MLYHAWASFECDEAIAQHVPDRETGSRVIAMLFPPDASNRPQ
jgi:hypothetical protein